ncbi:MAG: hypothetical protein KU38_06980 [Sulfurovum sp. FS08-3]|nr:MAG: hypothetical protein KU38_06980 [Sulfurovum sp. FS08-3]
MLRYFWFIFLVCTAMAQTPQMVRFAPLPMVKSQKLLEQYLPMLGYLESKIDVKFEIIYTQNYADLIDKLGNGIVDIALLGPLPYVEATHRYPHIKPLVRFLDEKGNHSYTCSLFALKTHNTTLNNLRNASFALTQKYSTCGFLATQKILYDHNSSLQNNQYIFADSHTNAILQVILGNAQLGSAKSSIVEQYKHFDLQILATSQPFAGFLLVYQAQTLPIGVINAIKEELLALKPLSNPSHAHITQTWGNNLRYGVVPANDSHYDDIRTLLQTIKLPL